MKRETGKGGLDRQIGNLTGTLREQGVAPDRDLWPEIEARIDQTASHQEPAGSWMRKPSRWAVWRIAAMAATVVLVLGLGYIGTSGNKGSERDRADAGGQSELAYNEGPSEVSTGPTALQRLDSTLRELNDAMIQDPDNRNLSRLVLLVHKSRSNVLQQNSQNWAR